MKYKYNEKSVIFKREEKEDGTVILLTNTQHQLVLNSTGKEVLNLLPNCIDTDEVVEQLSKEYLQINKSVLDRDVKEILRIFEIYKIIIIDDEPQVDDSDILYKITGDINYKEVSKFIQAALENESIKYYQESNKEFYTPLQLRKRVMGNYEYGVFAVQYGEVSSYMSLGIPPVDNCAVIVINSMFFKEGLSNIEIKNLLNCMMKRVLRIISSIKPLNKVRVSFFKEHGSDEKTIEILKEFGFEEECILKNETTYGDMKFYSLALQR